MDNDSRAWFRLIAVALAGSLIMLSACTLAGEQAGAERVLGYVRLDIYEC